MSWIRSLCIYSLFRNSPKSISLDNDVRNVDNWLKQPHQCYQPSQLDTNLKSSWMTAPEWDFVEKTSTIWIEIGDYWTWHSGNKRHDLQPLQPWPRPGTRSSAWEDSVWRDRCIYLCWQHWARCGSGGDRESTINGLSRGAVAACNEAGHETAAVTWPRVTPRLWIRLITLTRLHWERRTGKIWSCE